MNPIKFILTGAIALVIADSAKADTVVRITGSTAFRAATHRAIFHILQNGGSGTVNAAYEKVVNGAVNGASTALSGCDRAVFIGQIAGHSELGTVTFKTSWSGSTGGIQTDSNQLDVPFMPDVPSVTTAVSLDGSNNTIGGTQITTETNDATIQEKPLANMADTFQNTVPFNANSLTDTLVGVQPFQVIASNGIPATWTNLNTQVAVALWANGSLPLSLFTGLSTDQGTLVYATGRDYDSGTRANAFAEWGIGVNASVAQYKPTISGGAVSAWSLYPSQTVNGIFFDVGQGGEASGSTLRTNMGASCTAGVGYGVTYLSTGDAGTAIGLGAKALNWNGVPYSLTAVQQGQYTFWCYEHVQYLASLTGNSKTAIDSMATQIITTDSPVLLSTMKCQRQTDGGTVTNNF